MGWCSYRFAPACYLVHEVTALQEVKIVIYWECPGLKGFQSCALSQPQMESQIKRLLELLKKLSCKKWWVYLQVCTGLLISPWKSLHCKEGKIEIYREGPGSRVLGCRV